VRQKLLSDIFIDFELGPEMNSAVTNASSLKKSEQNSLYLCVNFSAKLRSLQYRQDLNRQKLLSAVFD